MACLRFLAALAVVLSVSPALADLPASVCVSGAGVPEVNGTYTYADTGFYEGPHYTMAGDGQTLYIVPHWPSFPDPDERWAIGGTTSGAELYVSTSNIDTDTVGPDGQSFSGASPPLVASGSCPEPLPEFISVDGAGTLGVDGIYYLDGAGYSRLDGFALCQAEPYEDAGTFVWRIKQDDVVLYQSTQVGEGVSPVGLDFISLGGSDPSPVVTLYEGSPSDDDCECCDELVSLLTDIRDTLSGESEYLGASPTPAAPLEVPAGDPLVLDVEADLPELDQGNYIGQVYINAMGGDLNVSKNINFVPQEGDWLYDTFNPWRETVRYLLQWLIYVSFQWSWLFKLFD